MICITMTMTVDVKDMAQPSTRKGSINLGDSFQVVIALVF
jgi:hypothetical protein